MLQELSLAWGMPIREVLLRTDSRELTEWWVRWSRDPWGTYRADLQFGLIASLLVRMFGGKQGRQTSPTDFLLFKNERKPTPQELMQKAMAITLAMGGRIRRRGDNS